MICPRCGTQALSDQPRCSRCAGMLVEPGPRDLAPVAVMGSPTRRGELQQATSGTVTVSMVELARAKRAAASPQVAPTDAGRLGLGAPVGVGLWPSPPAAQPTPGAPAPNPGAPAPYPASPAPHPGAAAPHPGGPVPNPGAGGSGQVSNPGPTTPAPGPAWTSPQPANQPWPPPPAPSGHWPQPPQPEGGAASVGDRTNPHPAAPNPLRVRSESPTLPEPDAPWVGSSPGWAAPSGGRWLARSLPATYWWQSLVMLLLVPPVGVAALYFSWLVTRRVGLGDGPGAVRASRLARSCCLLGAFVFALAVVVYSGTHPK